MTNVLEPLAHEARRLVDIYGARAYTSNSEHTNSPNCQLFEGLPFTDVEMYCDFACHGNPVYGMTDNSPCVVRSNKLFVCFFF